MTDQGSSESTPISNRNQDDSNNLKMILERHLSWVQAYVHRKLGNFPRHKSDTGDIVQDALVQFLKFGPRIHLTNDKQFRALLCRIISNVINNKYDWFTAKRRAYARERPLPADTVLNLDPPQTRQDTPSQIAHQLEREAWIRLGIELLDPDDREIIVLRNWDDLSFKEIGDQCEVSKSEARRKYLQALKHLIATVKALQVGQLDTLLGPDLSEEPDS